MDVERKVFAQRATIYALRGKRGASYFVPVEGFWQNDGKLLKHWCPYDFGDGVHLRVKVAQLSPLTRAHLEQVQAFGFSRDRGEQPRLFSVTRVDAPEIYSDRVWTFSCELINETWESQVSGALPGRLRMPLGRG